jgi:class 3 adenylate cyclase
MSSSPTLGDAKPAFRVLVVDDDPDMAAFLALMLRREGMNVQIANDGEAALAHVREAAPDLILCDVMMPGISGFEICQTLKGDEKTALIPLVLVTALEDSESRVRGIEAGADDFLSKPVNREELLARVKTLRRLHETRKELESRRLTAEIESKEAIRKAFLRYVSPKLAERILDSAPGGEGIFRNLSDRAAVVVLFADLRGFTRLSESVPVSSIVPMLNEFFTVLTEAAYENEGTVFSMAGDSLLVGFNVPLPQPDASRRALAAGRAMVERFAPVAQRWQEQHSVSAGIGIGIEAGEVIVGNVGSPAFMSYTIIGDTVNVAARLMQMAEPGEILIGPGARQTLEPVLQQGAARSRREVSLRGKAQPLEVFSLRLS